MPDSTFSDELVREYPSFRLACPHYDDLQDNIGTIISEHLERRFKDRPLPHSPLNVVDIGCGDGATSRAILGHYVSKFRCLDDLSIHIDLVDNNKTALAYARMNLGDYNYRVEMVQEDALAYLKRLGKHDVSVVASAFTFHNWEQDYRHAVLQEVCRILTPDGLFVNGDKYARDNPHAHEKDLQCR